MSRANGEKFGKEHLVRMAKLVAAGVGIFILFLAIIQIALSAAGRPLDATFYYFYPIMAGLGALFGFERWWGQEQGDYNPFHDK